MLDLISVIIPVYNVEAYIEDCLDSVVSQTYHNLDVIVIDDGSTDQSGIICDRYAMKYPFIRVIHQENQGLSAARNTGMDSMKGEWVVFIDSDDYVHPDMIRILYEVAIKRGVDIVRSFYQKSALSRKDISWNCSTQLKDIKTRQVTATEEMAAVMKNIHITYVWATIYRKSLVERLRFPVGYNYEDILFTSKVLCKAEKICWINERYYIYRQRQKSITHVTTSLKSLDICFMMEKRIELIQKRFPNLQYLAEDQLWSQTINLYNRMLEEGSIKEANVLLRKVKSEYLSKYLSWKALLDRHISLQNRAILFCCKLSFTGACRTKRLLININERIGLAKKVTMLRVVS